MAFAVVALVLGQAVGAPMAGAVSTAQSVIVSVDPANVTPHVVTGQVNAIVQIGNTVYAGGSFSQVRASASNSPTLTRNNLFAFDATTGQISTTFAPNVNGEVTALVPAADGAVALRRRGVQRRQRSVLERPRASQRR